MVCICRCVFVVSYNVCISVCDHVCIVGNRRFLKSSVDKETSHDLLPRPQVCHEKVAEMTACTPYRE